jgi:hypothetical protein
VFTFDEGGRGRGRGRGWVLGSNHPTLAWPKRGQSPGGSTTTTPAARMVVVEEEVVGRMM